MKTTFVCLLLLCFSYHLPARNRQRKSKPYTVRIIKMDQDVQKGSLTQFKDPSIVIFDAREISDVEIMIFNPMGSQDIYEKYRDELVQYMQK